MMPLSASIDGASADKPHYYLSTNVECAGASIGVSPFEFRQGLPDFGCESYVAHSARLVTRWGLNLIDQFVPPDADSDGIFDQCDNCVNTYNPDQADSDGDGIGNACEPTGCEDVDEFINLSDVPDLQTYINSLPSGTTLGIEAGTTRQTATIDNTVTIIACDGTVTIGEN